MIRTYLGVDIGGVNNTWVSVELFTIQTPHNEILLEDGVVDSLVCATIGYLFHSKPDKLFYLADTARDKRGRGPFIVLKPEK